MEKFGTIKKFSSRNGTNSDEYYDEILKTTIIKASEKIVQTRKILEELKKNKSNYGQDLIVDKVQNMVTGITDYKELTDEKIDELIELVKTEILTDN